jgi:hypothetical protein
MNSTKLLLYYFLLGSFACFAQGWEQDPDPGFGGGSGDPAIEPTSAPIDSIEMPLFITAVVVAGLVMNKRHKLR